MDLGVKKHSRRTLGRSALFGAVALGLAARGRVAAQDATPEPGATDDPLPSWAEGPIKERILAFVAATIDQTGPGYVPVGDRIATFDNEGTLWCEYPAPAFAYFAVDLARQLVETDSEAARDPMLREIVGAAMADPTEGLTAPSSYFPVFTELNGGMTQQRYIALCRDWLETATHPETGRRFIDMVYQPQLELLRLLDANGFMNFIVTGTSVDFVRAYAPVVYDIPAWRLIGTNYRYGFEQVDGAGQVVATDVGNTVVTGPNKATSIALDVGLRPIVAIGNSDGDLEMLQYAKGGPIPPLAMFVHHTDGEREYVYDRDYAWSPFTKALDLAPQQGIPLIDMKADWLTIWPDLPGPSLLTPGAGS